MSMSFGGSFQTGPDSLYAGADLVRRNEQENLRMAELRRAEAERQAIQNDPIFSRDIGAAQAPDYTGSGMTDVVGAPQPAAVTPTGTPVYAPRISALPKGEQPVNRNVVLPQTAPVAPGQEAKPTGATITAAQYQAMTPEQRLNFLKAENAKRGVVGAINAPAYVASGLYDVFAAPINLAARGVENVANYFNPNKDTVIPKVGDGSLTPMANQTLRGMAQTPPLNEQQYLEMLKQRDAARAATITKKQGEINAAEEKVAAERAAATQAPDWVYGANKRPIRGLLNNNPGNIDKTKNMWSGEIEGGDKRFKTFATPELGIRAIADNLRAYETKYGVNTVEGIIKRWAPDNENDTKSYINFVSGQLGVDPKTPLNLNDAGTLQALSTAIILKENGKNPYSPDLIAQGVNMSLTQQKVDAKGITAPTYYVATGNAPAPVQTAQAPQQAPQGAPQQVQVQTAPAGSPGAERAQPSTTQVQQVVQQVAAQPVPKFVQPEQIYNPNAYARPLQTALLQREQTKRLAEIQMRTGNVYKSLQTQAALATMDNQLYKLQGDQGVAEFLQSGGKDAGRMMAVFSYYTGNNTQLQPRTDGLYNVVINGKVASEGMSAAKIVERVRLTLDEGFRKTQADVAGKIFESSLKREEEYAKQLAQQIREIAIENIKGSYSLNAEKLKMMKFDVKPTGAGDGTVIVTPPFGSPYIFNPSGNTIEIDGVKVQSMAAKPITGMPSLAWANNG